MVDEKRAGDAAFHRTTKRQTALKPRAGQGRLRAFEPKTHGCSDGRPGFGFVRPVERKGELTGELGRLPDDRNQMASAVIAVGGSQMPGPEVRYRACRVVQAARK